MIAFIPLMRTPIPLVISEMLKSFLDFDVLPNLFAYMWDEKDLENTEPYPEALEFGFESGVFLANGGEMLSQAVCVLMLLPLALLLSKCKHHKIAGYFYDFAKSYRWSFFIRSWTEIFLEVYIAAYLQILRPSYENHL
jgi:hypothetical protein